MLGFMVGFGGFWLRVLVTEFLSSRAARTGGARAARVSGLLLMQETTIGIYPKGPKDAIIWVWGLGFRV